VISDTTIFTHSGNYLSGVTVSSLTLGSTTLLSNTSDHTGFETTTLFTLCGNHEPSVTTVSRMALRTILFCIIDNNESVVGDKMANA
jgi:hypothetical protein